ncbi:hypothetical protein GW17_00033899 [Ensete ventricosum]|nr:hypothetical protein GW17_00033899 [Ensete ventricosum]
MIAVDLGYATGLFTQLLYWENLSTQNLRRDWWNFCPAVRTNMVDMVVDQGRFVLAYFNCFCQTALCNQISVCFSCQTYEGGIAGEPGSEAHGGYISFKNLLVLVLPMYTFCGLAAMILINEADRLDLPSLVVLEGGFKDKPGKQRDFYHSCYCLSGLSVSQYSCSKDASVSPPSRAVLGPYANLLEPVHPLYNVVLNKYYKSHEFFSRL